MMTPKDIQESVKIMIEDTISIKITGDLDSKSGPDIKAEILNKMETIEKDITLNLEDVPYIDSSGINVLLTIHRVQMDKDKKLSIIHATDSVKKIISLSNLDKILYIKS
jgi:anti-anti-sigma factor